MTITKRPTDIFSVAAFTQSVSADLQHRLMFFLFTAFIFAFLCYMMFMKRSVSQTKTQMIKLTPQLEIPCPSGQKQYGSARFANEAEREKSFRVQLLNPSDKVLKSLLEQGKLDKQGISNGVVHEFTPLFSEAEIKQFKCAGIPVEFDAKSNHSELVKLIAGDVHTVCFGSTRCGKTRTLVVQSLVLQALAGVDMITSDPKGELFQYTYPLLSRLGYKVFALDFKNPKRSIRYNFLQFIINAIDDGDISKAISCCWDFVDAIVVQSKNGDPLWSNGEKGLLAAATMQVVYDNSKMGLRQQYSVEQVTDDDIEALYESKHKHFQNCINLFNYISKMTVENPVTKRLMLEDIISVLPANHPSKLTLAIAESAPSKTRGSFITSALATLRLFTDPNIAAMTSSTDEGFLSLDFKKAIFIILPDTKQTYYPLSRLSFFITIIFTNNYNGRFVATNIHFLC